MLYCDTDPVIYVQNANGPHKSEKGDYLGHLTEELEDFGSDSFIEEFISVGPKNYGFSDFRPSIGKCTTKCKVKGISMNNENSNVVYFTNLRDMILKDTAPVHVRNPKKVKRKHGDVTLCLNLRHRGTKSSLRSAGLWATLTPYPMGMINLFDV